MSFLTTRVVPATGSRVIQQFAQDRRSAESWMAMQANHTLARYQDELEQWTPSRQVTAKGLVAVKGSKSKAERKLEVKPVSVSNKTN